MRINQQKIQNIQFAVSLILISTVSLLSISCKECTTEPMVYPPTELSLDYRGANFVWLRLSMADSGSVQSYTIKRNNAELCSGRFFGADTLITDDTVLPDSTYIYKAYRTRRGNPVDSSDAVEVITMDTTSHDFHWEIDTLGDYGSGLRDVFVFSENDVWVVGEITIDDEPGELYGAAIWDGNNWNLKKLEVGISEVRPRGIFAFSSNDIWFACGGIFHWDGTQTTYEWARNLDTNESVEKVWGSDPDNIYFVGKEGIIVHYDGINFTRMDSGTDAELKDIDGVYDPITGETRIWVTGTGVLLYSEGDDWQVIWDYEHPYFDDNFNNPNTVYVPDEKVFTVSVWGGDNSGVYLFNQLHPQENQLLFNHDLYVRGMAGNDINDFFIVGNLNKVYHYNGNTAKCYPQNEIGGYALGISQIGNYVFVAGVTSGASYRAVVFRGVR